MAAKPAKSHGIKTELDDPTKIFEILAKLGEGSYGSVYKALDKRDGKICAIKVLEVENEDIAELRKEINILKDCHSEFIVAYKGAYEKDNNIWIVMEYCGAGSVCDLMAICEKTLNEKQIAVVMKQSLHGLAYLHSHKKIHRDIKSGNILLNHEGDCKLADFGVSAELTTTMAKRKTVIGTPYWMAPEVLQSVDYNSKADIWSLAITAIELAVGEPPHSNVHPMRAIFLIPTSDPPTLPNPEKWSKEFNDFLRVCLVKDPEKRPSAVALQEHPFIKNSGEKKIIADLVEECMKEIDEYREQEAKDAEEKDSTFGDDGVENGSLAPGEVDGSATLVYNRGEGGATLVRRGGGGEDEEVEDGGEEAGEDEDGAELGARATLVVKSKAGAAVAAAAAAAAPAAAAPAAEKKAAPAAAAAAAPAKEVKDAKDAKDAKENKTMQKQHPGATRFPTISSSGTLVAKGGGDFMQYYRTGQSLDVDAGSSLLDLRMSLISLNKAYEDEMAALEAFYAKRKQQLKDLIAKKEKELEAAKGAPAAAAK